MSPITSSLEVHVHGVDGHVSRFARSNPESVERLLREFQPKGIFAPRRLFLSDGSRRVFACAAVVRVDLVMDGFPEWPFHPGISDVLEITEEEFQQRCHSGEVAAERPGVRVVAFGKIELANGQRLYLELRAPAACVRMDQRSIAHAALSAPSLFFRRRGGGAILVNTANIVRLTLSTGQGRLMPNSGVASH
jgi:hypothetical protein